VNKVTERRSRVAAEMRDRRPYCAQTGGKGSGRETLTKFSANAGGGVASHISRPVDSAALAAAGGLNELLSIWKGGFQPLFLLRRL
jgi:hypothetical protein